MIYIAHRVGAVVFHPLMKHHSRLQSRAGLMFLPTYILAIAHPGLQSPSQRRGDCEVDHTCL